MLDLVSNRQRAAATEAEAAVRALDDRGFGGTGSAVAMIVGADGRSELAFSFPALPPPPETSRIAAVIRKRFENEPRFARDLLGFLDGQGRVFSPRPARGCCPDILELPR